MKIRRLGYALGAEVTGIDLSQPLDEATTAVLRQAWLDHVVLVFRKQDLSLDAFRSFCGKFGPLDDNRGTKNRHPNHPEVLIKSSTPVMIDGKESGGYGLADYWHTDRSHLERPTTISFLLNKQLPDVGGNTLFANTYTAYETLSPAFRSLVDPLLAVHDYSLEPIPETNRAEVIAQRLRDTPPVVQRLVRPHPESGRPALYLGMHRIRKFVGMTEEETKPILDYLHEHATRYEFTYRHTWELHDLVAWDNSGSLHYAVQDYDHGQLRNMVRCALLAPKTGYVYQEGADAPQMAAAAG